MPRPCEAIPKRRGSIEPTDDTVGMMANCEGDYVDWVEWLVDEATVEIVAGWWGAVQDLILCRDAWLLSAPQQQLRKAVAAGDLAALATAVRHGAVAVGCIGAAHLAACAHPEAVISLLQRGCSVDALLPAAPWSRLALCSPQLDAAPGPADDGAESPFDALGGRDAALRYVESALAGASPLHCAALCGHAANVHLLIAAGARPERTNARGDTAADLAMIFEPLHTPLATNEILAALAATSQSHCVVVYSHVCMQMQTATRVRLAPISVPPPARLTRPRLPRPSSPTLCPSRAWVPTLLAHPALAAPGRGGQGGDATAEERARRRAEQRVASAGHGGSQAARAELGAVRAVHRRDRGSGGASGAQCRHCRELAAADCRGLSRSPGGGGRVQRDEWCVVESDLRLF